MTTFRLSRPLAALRLSGLPLRLARLATLSRSRHGLARLDDHLLQDIGLTRSEAMVEANRAPWDAPSHWKA